MSDTQTTEQFTERQMYAAIALTDLPMPTTVSMHHGILALDFLSIADGQAWASRLGADCAPFADRRGRRYLSAHSATWHGWRVQINASEDGAPDGELDDDTATRLADIVRGESR